MVGCRAVAVLLLALVSAVAEDAAEDAAARLYLVEGVAPAAGRLEAAAVERAVEALSLDVAAGGLAPPDAVAAGERAVAAGLGFAGAALLNNAASKCGALYGGDDRCDRRSATLRARRRRRPSRASRSTTPTSSSRPATRRRRPTPSTRPWPPSAPTAPATATTALGSPRRRSAPHALSAAELPGRYARLLRRLEALAVELEAAPDPRTEPRGLRLVGNLPIAWPYLGYAALPLTRRLGRLYAAADRAWAGGIAAHVLERRGEPTPVLRKPRVAICVEFNHCDFAAAARAAAAAVVDLDPGDLAASATALAGAEADVVVYLALGLSHVTYNLARCRLAPVQVVFGHGHPMSAGLGDAIDYFVSSKLYEADVANLMDGDAGRLAVLAEAAVLADVREPGLARPPPIVLPTRARPRAVDAAAAPRASRPTPAATRRRSASPPPCPTAATGPGLRRAARRAPRAGLQHSKKLHPDFDASLAAVFAKAPGDALVLMLEGARTHLARWNATLGPAAAARLVFLPRMPREDLLAIVRVSDALLDTHPWGGGVTVLEALAVCTPPVVLPSRTSVLQLALGHLRTLQLDDQLVARDSEAYGALAARIATEPAFRQLMRLTICRRNAWLFEADKAVDEWARFLRNGAADAPRAAADGLALGRVARRPRRAAREGRRAGVSLASSEEFAVRRSRVLQRPLRRRPRLAPRRRAMDGEVGAVAQPLATWRPRRRHHV
ncbi:hypothetical protein JL720_13304 [Aureococcus anophagefferens]|nr:hypothetical protein JL720_13304 [Aureococcus anophagefferens]